MIFNVFCTIFMCAYSDTNACSEKIDALEFDSMQLWTEPCTIYTLLIVIDSL